MVPLRSTIFSTKWQTFVFYWLYIAAWNQLYDISEPISGVNRRVVSRPWMVHSQNLVTYSIFGFPHLHTSVHQFQKQTSGHWDGDENFKAGYSDWDCKTSVSFKVSQPRTRYISGLQEYSKAHCIQVLAPGHYFCCSIVFTWTPWLKISFMNVIQLFKHWAWYLNVQ